jgi:hypothetical protein
VHTESGCQKSVLGRKKKEAERTAYWRSEEMVMQVAKGTRACLQESGMEKKTTIF